MRASVQLGLAAGYFLATCLLGVLLFRPLWKRPVEIGEPSVEVGFSEGQVEVTAHATVLPRARARLVGFTGGVFARGMPLEAEVTLAPPDGELRAGRPEQVRVKVSLPLATAGTLAAGSVLDAGRIALAFDGRVDIEVLGYPLSLPVHIEHRLDASALLKERVMDMLPGAN